MDLSTLPLTSDNLKFLETLKIGNLGYIKKKELYNKIYLAVNIKYPRKTFILKRISLSETSPTDLNVVVDSLRAVQNFIIGDCKYSNNFICYDSIYLSLEDGKNYLNYTYEEAKGISLLNVFPDEDIDFSLLALIAYRLFSNLAILHKYGICHRDIKPENIIYNKDGNNLNYLMLIDFDFGCIKNLCNGVFGTSFYAPFDIIFNKNIDWEAVDIKCALITIIKIYTSTYSEYYYNKENNTLKKEVVYSLILKTYLNRKINKVNTYTKIEYTFINFLFELLCGNENLNAIYILRKVEKIFRGCLPKEIIII